MGLRIRCTVRSLGPRKPPPLLKPVLLQLIKEVLKRPRTSRPRRHSVVLIVQKKCCDRTEPGSSAAADSRSGLTFTPGINELQP